VIVTNNYSLGAVGPLPAPAARELVAPIPAVDANGAPIKPPPIPLAPPPQPVWLAGPGGPTVTKAQAAWLKRRTESGGFNGNSSNLAQPEPAFRFQTQATPTAEPAWLASRGEGSSQLRGFFDNTAVFDLISDNF
jgi:hypothetical protein